MKLCDFSHEIQHDQQMTMLVYQLYLIITASLHRTSDFDDGFLPAYILLPHAIEGKTQQRFELMCYHQCLQ